MSAPPVEDASLVAFYGAESERVRDVWAESERPFELVCLGDETDSVRAVVGERPVDCVVVQLSDESERAILEAVRDVDADVPIVVFDGEGVLTFEDVIDLAVTHQFAPSREVDPVECVRKLAPLVERIRRDRRERSMFDSLLRHIPLSVYFKDRTGRHLRASDELPRMVGPPYLEAPDGKRHHAPEDVIGKTDFDLYPLGLAEGAVEDDRHVVESGESIDERIERSAGGDLDEMYVATSKAPWYDRHGRVGGVVGITRDITDRQKYERQLERQNEQLERFARVVSHDLRNPLDVATGWLEIARESGDEEHFETVRNALNRMAELIDDVLTLARQGETVSDPEKVALPAVAEDAWNSVETDDATLVVETDATVLADAGRLRQLFENLFRNSVEHGSTGPRSHTRADSVEHGRPDVRVRVRVGNLAERPGFFVEDDGPGIPQADREDVFESGYTTDSDGTGLGLSIVRSIADAHGWAVAVTESELESDADDGPRGARFEFSDVQSDEQ